MTIPDAFPILRDMMASVGSSRSREGSAMTDEAYAGTRQNVTGRAKDIAIRARDALSVALMEVAAWDFFKWAVIALLAMNLLVMLLFLGSIKSSLAELKDRAAPPSQTGDVSAETAKQMADVKAALTQSIADMQSGLRDDITKLSAKIDARAQVTQPKPVQPAASTAPKPQAVPKPKKPVTQP
jgi:methyl-accepting chemotaxis protein